jgi:CheY-like chemotaxis protein
VGENLPEVGYGSVMQEPDDGARHLRLLVVDDNPLIRDSVAAAVQRINARMARANVVLHLYEVEDGATAWDRVNDTALDLVIVDLYIPVLDGLGLIARIRNCAATAAVKVLAISASIEDARVRSLGAGADQFLQKPLRLVDLTDAIGNLLKLDLK